MWLDLREIWRKEENMGGRTNKTRCSEQESLKDSLNGGSEDRRSVES